MTLIRGPFFDWTAVQQQVLCGRVRKGRLVDSSDYFRH
jgi:hypothetical protein